MTGRWVRAATRYTVKNYHVSQKGWVAFHKQENDFVEVLWEKFLGFLAV